MGGIHRHDVLILPLPLFLCHGGICTGGTDSMGTFVGLRGLGLAKGPHARTRLDNGRKDGGDHAPTATAPSTAAILITSHITAQKAEGKNSKKCNPRLKSSLERETSDRLPAS